MKPMKQVKICVCVACICALLFHIGSNMESITHMVRDQLTSRYVEPIRNEAPLITLFTSWRTFPDRYKVYNNTLRNWLTLQPHVRLLLFSDEHIPNKYKQLGWTVIPLKHQIKGHAVLKYMFLEAMELVQNSQLYGFSNGDLLFTRSLIDSLLAITTSPLLNNRTYMVVGRRMNTPNVTREEASSWENIVKASKRGQLMPATYGIDYFFTTPKYNWQSVPDVQIGRYYYDNWVVYDARRRGYKVIDATGSLLAVHQNAPYPKDRVAGDNNIGFINNTKMLMKGVVPCCDFHTIYINRTAQLEKSKSIPMYCAL
ncbi:uncharacterized protein [Argopecten irradians]|uniref:uncharacterized protein n=1 Tax=Argopecten irradians TaxID=31199 RepID=UPI00371CA91A